MRFCASKGKRELDDLHVERVTFTFADTLAAMPVRRGDFVRVFYRIEPEEAFRRIYGELAADGTINREVYAAPFSGLLAIVTDRNGVCWVLPIAEPRASKRNARVLCREYSLLHGRCIC